MTNSEAIEVLNANYPDSCFELLRDAVDTAIYALSTRPGWIPCSTALPKEGKYVLCQCRAGIMDVLRLTDVNDWYKDSTHIYMHSFVLAWMPLPEPYKEKER